MKRRRKLGYIVACPECGHTLTPHNIHEAMPEGVPEEQQAFDCPRCAAHYTAREFWQEQEFKWNRSG